MPTHLTQTHKGLNTGTPVPVPVPVGPAPVVEFPIPYGAVAVLVTFVENVMVLYRVSVLTALFLGPFTFVLVIVLSAGVSLTVFVTVTGEVTVPCSVLVLVCTLVCGQLQGLILYSPFAPTSLALAVSTMVEVSVVLKFWVSVLV